MIYLSSNFRRSNPNRVRPHAYTKSILVNDACACDDGGNGDYRRCQEEKSSELPGLYEGQINNILEERPTR